MKMVKKDHGCLWEESDKYLKMTMVIYGTGSECVKIELVWTQVVKKKEKSSSC